MGSGQFPVLFSGRGKGKERERETERAVERIEEVEKKEGDAEACYVVSERWDQVQFHVLCWLGGAVRLSRKA